MILRGERWLTLADERQSSPLRFQAAKRLGLLKRPERLSLWPWPTLLA